MRDGLDFNEDYVDGGDVARHRDAVRVRAKPTWLAMRRRARSGRARHSLQLLVGHQQHRGPHPRRRAGRRGRDSRRSCANACSPRSGCTTPSLALDEAGTFIGLVLRVRTGAGDGQVRLAVPARRHVGRPAASCRQGWVDHARRQRSWDPVDQVGYGAHWWTTGDDLGTFRASGYEGQIIVVCPAHDLLVVRFGKTDAVQAHDLAAWRARMVRAFEPAG